jgi:ribosome-binding factor A
MASIRQEKMARVVKEVVSDAIINRLSDPRIEGFVSVMEVHLPPDLRSADVYLSIFGKDEKTSHLTFTAIEHAAPKIQSLLAHRLETRYCPTLRFHESDKLKKTIETMKIIDEAAKEIPHKPDDKDKDKDEESHS